MASAAPLRMLRISARRGHRRPRRVATVRRRLHRTDRTASDSAGSKKSTPLMRVWAVKGTNCACGSATSRPRRLNCCLASTTIERPSGVSSASEASCAASASRSGRMPGAGMKALAMRLPRVMVPVLSSSSTSTSPGGLDGPAAGRQHVALDQAVHAADADGAEQAADGGGNQADQQRDQHRHREDHPGVDAKGLERHTDQQEDERERRQQNGQRDLVRRLLPLRALPPCAIMRSRKPGPSPA